MDTILYASVPLVALIIDAVYGDPRSDYHPVVLIGKIISAYESLLYPKKKASHASMLFRGTITVFAVLTTVGCITALLTWLAYKTGMFLFAVVSAIILYFTISPRALARDGMEIYSLLAGGDIASACKRLSWIVGRDTETLDEYDIARATVETIAENTTDGIISPLFYFLLFGPVGAMVYRAGNTMDSMLGYKTDRYLFFGRFAAKLDDGLNYIPARITFLLFVAASFILRLDYKKAWKIGLRDAPKHPSPNGGYAEATVAGAMHVRLGGYNYYQGEREFREYMGDMEQPLNRNSIKTSIFLMYGATILFVLIETILLCSIGWMR
ncbi:MAG: adenosylcobinamide-phosphate synthase CbiB [Dialister sp.]|nr:adenosylcobinamide-phosphate synthase CbiB [Dialister sp.]